MILPIELWRTIYEWDSTYSSHFSQKVLPSILAYRKDYEVYPSGKSKTSFVIVHFSSLTCYLVDDLTSPKTIWRMKGNDCTYFTRHLNKGEKIPLTSSQVAVILQRFF